MKIYTKEMITPTVIIVGEIKIESKSENVCGNERTVWDCGNISVKNFTLNFIYMFIYIYSLKGWNN